jgi:hypothetical protein
MAGLDNIKGYNGADGSSVQVDVPTAKAAPVKSAAGYQYPTPIGAVGVDPSILEQMKKIVAEKESQKGSFLESLRDANAWWSGGVAGPGEALRARASEREGQNAEIFNMRNMLAQNELQQKQIQNSRTQDLASGWGPQGSTGVGAGGTGAIPQNIVEQYNRILQTQGLDAANRFRSTYLQEHQKKLTDPAMLEKLVDVYDNTKPEGSRAVQIPALEYYNNPARYSLTPESQARLGQTPPPAAATTTAPAAANQNAPISVRQNNPGNLVDTKTGEIKTFGTPEEGSAALDKDLTLKLTGQSDAYNRRFAGVPVTPATLAETWAPATAKGNTPESTGNYAIKIAQALGIQPTDPIPNTPEAAQKVKQAITQFEAGPTAAAPTAPAAPSFKPLEPVAALEKVPLNAAPAETAPVAKTTAAPATTAAAAPAALMSATAVKDKPLSQIRAERAANEEYQKTTAGETAKNIQAEEKTFLERTEPNALSARESQSQQFDTWMQKWGGNKRVAGILNEPGFGNAVAGLLETGIQTPIGSLSLPGIVDAVRKMLPGTSKEEIEAAQELSSIMGNKIFEVVKQSKGSSSDKDWIAFRQIAGSASNGYDFLNKVQKYDAATLKRDKADRSLYDSQYQENKPTDYKKHSISAERKRIYKEHQDEVGQIYKSKYAPVKVPDRPAGIPAGAKVQYSPSTKKWYVNGKEWTGQ